MKGFVLFLAIKIILWFLYYKIISRDEPHLLKEIFPFRESAEPIYLRRGDVTPGIVRTYVISKGNASPDVNQAPGVRKGRRERKRERGSPPTRGILRWGINWYASSIRHVGRMKEGDSRQCLSANATPHRASGAFSRKLSEHRDTYQLIFTGRTVRYIYIVRSSSMVDSSRFFEQKMKQLFLETLIPDFWKININIASKYKYCIACDKLKLLSIIRNKLMDHKFDKIIEWLIFEILSRNKKCIVLQHQWTNTYGLIVKRKTCIVYNANWSSFHRIYLVTLISGLNSCLERGASRRACATPAPLFAAVTNLITMRHRLHN